MYHMHCQTKDKLREIWRNDTFIMPHDMKTQNRNIESNVNYASIEV